MHPKHITYKTIFQSLAAAFVVALALSPLAARTAFDTDEQVTMQRFQRIATATLAYTSDHDGVLPLSMSFDTLANRWRTGSYSAVPGGWTLTANRDIPPRSIEEKSFVLNAVRPYSAVMYDFVASGMPAYNHAFVQTRLRPIPALPQIGVNFNGSLHSWPIDAVTTPSRLPLFTQNYSENGVGSAVSLPVLCCTEPSAQCKFNPTGYPQPGQTTCGYFGSGYGDVWFLSTSHMNFSVWAYGHKLVFAQVDGSVRSVPLEAPVWPQYAQNINQNPWSSYESGDVPGSPYWISQCVQPHHNKRDANSVYYAGYFRPDNEFDYTLQQCDFGGG